MADLDDHIRHYSRRQLGLVTTEQIDQWVDAKKMTQPGD